MLCAVLCPSVFARQTAQVDIYLPPNVPTTNINLGLFESDTPDDQSIIFLLGLMNTLTSQYLGKTCSDEGTYMRWDGQAALPNTTFAEGWNASAQVNYRPLDEREENGTVSTTFVLEEARGEFFGMLSSSVQPGELGAETDSTTLAWCLAQ